MSEEEEEITGIIAAEEAEGTVQCNNCTYWGTMAGFINPDKPKVISFICPECNFIEQVVNPFG